MKVTKTVSAVTFLQAVRDISFIKGISKAKAKKFLLEHNIMTFDDVFILCDGKTGEIKVQLHYIGTPYEMDNIITTDEPTFDIEMDNIVITDEPTFDIEMEQKPTVSMVLPIISKKFKINEKIDCNYFNSMILFKYTE